MTEGKVFSIYVECMAYAWGEMKERTLNECIGQGNSYNHTINVLSDAYKTGTLDPELPYFCYEKRNEFLRYSSGFYYRDKVFALTEKLFQHLQEVAPDKKTNEFLRSKGNYAKNFDMYIVVPGSKIVNARLKEK